jgi:ATP-dependent Clp protease ATP-binding subunit ClpC
MKERVMSELRKTFRPEFLNRVDELIVFHPLGKEHLKEIIGLMLKELGKRIKDKKLKLEVTEEAKDILLEEGFNEEYGARPLRRAIQKLVEDQLSDGLLEGKFTSGDTVLVDATEGKINLVKK